MIYCIYSHEHLISLNALDRDITQSEEYTHDMFVINTKSKDVNSHTFINVGVTPADINIFLKTLRISRKNYLRYKKRYVRDNT